MFRLMLVDYCDIRVETFPPLCHAGYFCFISVSVWQKFGHVNIFPPLDLLDQLVGDGHCIGVDCNCVVCVHPLSPRYT